MIWHSIAAGPNGRPLVLGLAATPVGRSLRIEALFVNAKLPGGPLPGIFIPNERSNGWAMTVDWPEEFPFAGVSGRLHPVDGWTPEDLILRLDGTDYVVLKIIARET